MKPKSNPFLRLPAGMSQLMTSLSVGLAFACSMQSAHAVDRTWDAGGGTSAWNTLTNWSSDTFANGDNALINTSTGFFPIITANPSSKPADVMIGTTTGQTGRLDHQSGLLQLNVIGASGTWFKVGQNGGTGTYNLADTTTGSSIADFGLGSGSLTVGKLFVGGAYFAANGTGVININTTGTISAQSTQSFTDGAAGQNASVVVGRGATGNGTINLKAGTVNATGDTWIGSIGVGTINQTGGTYNATGSILLARNNTNAQGGDGTWNVSGTGTVNSTGDLVIAYAGNSGAIGQMNINSGGTVNVGTGGKKWLIVNQYDAAQGQLVVDGGNLNIQNNTDLKFSSGNSTGTSYATVKNGGAITGGASSVVDLMTANVAGNNTFNLDGGTLTIGQVITTSNSGTAAFNFNGGTLKASASSANFVDLGGAGQTAVVKSGGASINSNGFNVTVVQALLNGTGGGGLTKSGSGTLTLSAANTYTGATNINGGTLTLGAAGSVNNSSGIVIDGSGAKFLQTSSTASTPAVTLTNGTLDGTGTVGAVTVGAGTGGVVANGNGGTGVLTLASLSFSGAGGMVLNLANATAGGLAVTGAVTTGANGTVTVNTLNLLNLGTTYNLVSSSDFSGSDLSDYVYGGNTARKIGTFGYSGGFLNLTVNGDTPKWTGGDSGNWVAGSTGGNSNWKLVNANSATDYIANDDVLFDDSATGSTSINISGGVVNPNSMVFNNSSLAYSLGGSGIGDGSGPTSLVKNGSAKVTLTNTNSYTGLTTINAGTLELGNGTTDGSIAGTSSVSNNGTLAYNLAGNQSVAYAISGTGSVTKAGAGTLTMGSQAYSGGTTVNAGTLKLTTTTGTANSGTFNLGGGTLQVDLGAGTNFGYAPVVNLTADSSIGNAAAGSLANLNGQINFTGTINGNGNALNVANTGLARLYMNGTFTGVSQINVQSGAMGFDIDATANRGGAPVVVSSGAALWFAGANTNPITNSLTFNGGNGINSGGALYYEGGSMTPAALSGNVTLAGGNTGIGTAYAADTITLAGDITGSGGLTQIKGNTVLSGANDYSGGTTIASGVLTANSSSALGTGNVGISAVSGTQLRLGNGVNVANALTISGGGVVAQGVVYVPTGDATYSGAINITGVQSAGGHFAANNGTLSLTGPITSSVPVTIRNGTVVLTSNVNSFSALAVQQGTAKLGADNAIPTTASVDLGISGAATLDLAGYNQTLAGISKNTNAATVTNSGTSDATLTITGTSTFSGIIQDGGTNKTALTVNGGIVTLTGNNTYTGATTVTAGTLLVTGSLASVTTIDSGATLGGSGSMGATLIASGATLSVGNSPGELTFTSTLTLEGTTLVEIGGLARATQYDAVNVDGLLTYGGALDIVSFDLGGGSWDLTQLAAYDLFDIGASSVGSFDSVTVGGNALTLSGGIWTGTDMGNPNITYTFNQMTGDLTVVPEPASLMLGALGALFLIRRRR